MSWCAWGMRSWWGRSSGWRGTWPLFRSTRRPVSCWQCLSPCPLPTTPALLCPPHPPVPRPPSLSLLSFSVPSSSPVSLCPSPPPRPALPFLPCPPPHLPLSPPPVSLPCPCHPPLSPRLILPCLFPPRHLPLSCPVSSLPPPPILPCPPIFSCPSGPPHPVPIPISLVAFPERGGSGGAGGGPSAANGEAALSGAGSWHPGLHLRWDPASAARHRPAHLQHLHPTGHQRPRAAPAPHLGLHPQQGCPGACPHMPPGDAGTDTPSPSTPGGDAACRHWGPTSLRPPPPSRLGATSPVVTSTGRWLRTRSSSTRSWCHPAAAAPSPTSHPPGTTVSR